MKKLEYQWFVKPRNGLTNQLIMNSGYSFDINLRQEKGQRFYKVEWEFIKYLYIQEEDWLNFSVHNRLGENGELYNITKTIRQMFPRNYVELQEVIKEVLVILSHPNHFANDKVATTFAK